MTDAPERPNHRGMAHFFVARDNRRHRDHVIGISGMAHSKEEAERDDGEKSDHFSFEILDELNLRGQVRRLVHAPFASDHSTACCTNSRAFRSANFSLMCAW